MSKDKIKDTIDDIIGGIRGPLKDAILLNEKPKIRGKDIQRALTVAKELIEMVSAAATPMRIAFSFMGMTMRYPTYEYVTKDGEVEETDDPDLAGKNLSGDAANDDLVSEGSTNGIDEPQLYDNEAWDSSSRTC